jgi:purine nucleoside phosphorylase
MKIGILSGSGTYSLAGLELSQQRDVNTRFGPVSLSEGRLAGTEVAHVSRHGEGHVRLSSHVNHRANITALAESGVGGVIALTVCGAVDPSLPLGGLIVFDDLYFPSNRLPDGSLCSLHERPGIPGRGHWIYEQPFSEPLRSELLGGATEAGRGARETGCYGHVDGPRFNTRSEIGALAAAGVSAVSQTAGPETVLCGEAELPYALLGYVTDYANGVMPEPTPVAELSRLMASSTAAFAEVLAATLGRLAGMEIAPVGTNLGWP